MCLVTFGSIPRPTILVFLTIYSIMYSQGLSPHPLHGGCCQKFLSSLSPGGLDVCLCVCVSVSVAVGYTVSGTGRICCRGLSRLLHKGLGKHSAGATTGGLDYCGWGAVFWHVCLCGLRWKEKGDYGTQSDT